MKLRFQHGLVILLLGAAAWFVASYVPQNMPDTVDRIKSLKVDLEGWRLLEDIKIDHSKYTALDPESLIFRNYINREGKIVNLTVVYHLNDRWGAHDPTLCYISQGWDISKKESTRRIAHSDKAYTVTTFAVQKGNIRSLVYYYWFTTNSKISAHRNRQMLNMVINGLLHGYTESGFVRISTNLNISNKDHDIQALNEFTNKFTKSLMDQLNHNS